MAQEVQPISSLPAYQPLGSDFLLAWSSTRDTFRVLVDDLVDQAQSDISITSGQIIDATTPGRNLLTAPSVAAQQGFLGLGAYAQLASADFGVLKQGGSLVVTDAIHPPHDNRPALDLLGESAGAPTWNGAAWPAPLPPIMDHGSLMGLSEDDHPQYLTEARGDARYSLTGDSRFHTHTNKTSIDRITEAAGLPLWNGATWPGGGGGSSSGAGTGSAAWDYDFDPASTAPAPASGTIRFNNASPVAATVVYISNTTKSGADLATGLMNTPVGSILYIQEWDNSAFYAEFTVTTQTAQTGYVQFQVTPRSFGSTPRALKVGMVITKQQTIMHGTLLGLSGDDHAQYFNQVRGDARYALAGSVISAHSGLSGLTADDHAQYFNQSRGDARYALGSALTAHTGNTSNPHITTAAQVGADPTGSAAAVNATLTAHTGNTAIHVPAVGTTGFVLTVVSGSPAWAAPIITESVTVKKIKVDDAGTNSDTLYLITT